MNFPWAICLDSKAAAALGPLRLWPGVDVAEEENRLWVCGPPLDANYFSQLLQLPILARYQRVGENKLRRIDSHFPVERLPALGWTPIRQWVRVNAPPAALPAEQFNKSPLRLVRCNDEEVSDLLLTSWGEWSVYAMQAPAVRLSAWEFAVTGNGAVLVRGRPLPSIPGRQYVLHDSIAVPAGFKWWPEVSLAALMRAFGAGPDQLVLWLEDESCARVHREQFIRATRGAIRATATRFVPPPPGVSAML